MAERFPIRVRVPSKGKERGQRTDITVLGLRDFGLWGEAGTPRLCHLRRRVRSSWNEPASCVLATHEAGRSNTPGERRRREPLRER